MLVLLDRDGVICEDIPETGVTHVSQLKLIDGSAEAIAQLRAAGASIAVVTNQSCVGKGLISESELAEIHATLREMLRRKGADWDELYVCTDAPDAATHRRKPAPGMILEALADFGAEAEQSPLVGDALRDLQAAKSAGCPCYLVRTGKGKTLESQGLDSEVLPCPIVDDLNAATQCILRDFAW